MPTSEVRYINGLGWTVYLAGRKINVQPFASLVEAMQFVRDMLVR